MDTLKAENQMLREEKMAENLSSQAIIDSLQEILEEQREQMEVETQQLQNKVKEGVASICIKRFNYNIVALEIHEILDNRMSNFFTVECFKAKRGLQK